MPGRVFLPRVMVTWGTTTTNNLLRLLIAARRQLSLMACLAMCLRCHASYMSTQMCAAGAPPRSFGATCASRSTEASMTTSSTQRRERTTSWESCQQVVSRRRVAWRLRHNLPRTDGLLGATATSTSHSNIRQSLCLKIWCTFWSRATNREMKTSASVKRLREIFWRRNSVLSRKNVHETRNFECRVWCSPRILSGKMHHDAAPRISSDSWKPSAKLERV